MRHEYLISSRRNLAAAAAADARHVAAPNGWTGHVPCMVDSGISGHAHEAKFRLMPPLKSLFIAALLALALGGCSRHSKPAQELPEVSVAPPLHQDVSISSEWIGTTVGFIDAEIHSEVTGYLLSQNYKEGAIVRKGDLLFQIDPRPFQALVDQARARVQAASAQLTEARAEVDQAKAEIDRAEAALGKTELDVKRYSPLVSDGTVSQQELDDAVQANLANKAAVAATQGRYEKARAAVATAAANVEVAQRGLDGADLNLGFTRVTSPIEGIAGIRGANIGDLVGTGGRSVLTTVSQVDPIFVEFPVSEQEYLALRSFLLGSDGDQRTGLELILADGKPHPHRGAINIIGREINPSTGTLRVRGLFPNPGNVLRPGQYARIRAVTRVRMGALLVPQGAVEELQGSYQVIVVGPSNRCEIRSVTVGERVGSYWLIERGLKPTDRVLIEGLQKVRGGDEVKPAPAKLPPFQSSTA